MSKAIMSPAELAEYLGLAKITIYKYVKKGKLPAQRVGRLLRFRRDEIDQWLKKQGPNSWRPPTRRKKGPFAEEVLRKADLETINRLFGTHRAGVKGSLRREAIYEEA